MAGTPQRQLQASVIPVLYPKSYIEKRKIDITDYAKKFCRRNREQGRLITRHDVEWYWEGNIRAEYDTVDPAHHWLISQTKCPKFQEFWVNTTAPLALREERLFQQQQQGFWPLRPNARERKHFESAVILGNHIERWIIPHVSLMAVEDVAYEDFVHDVREANPQGLRGSTVFRLWGALIKNAYDFVPKEVQAEKLREAFSRYPPTTEAGLEEFFGTSSKKRKSAPGSDGDTSEDERPERIQKRKRVSIGGAHIREFDDESILDPTLKPILYDSHEPSMQPTANQSVTASIRSLIGADGGEGGEDTVDPAEERIQALEKELAELRIAKDDLEHRLKSEIDRTTIAEMRVEALEGNLQESRDRVAQLEKRPTKDI